MGVCVYVYRYTTQLGKGTQERENKILLSIFLMREESVCVMKGSRAGDKRILSAALLHE